MNNPDLRRVEFDSLLRNARRVMPIIKYKDGSCSEIVRIQIDS